MPSREPGVRIGAHLRPGYSRAPPAGPLWFDPVVLLARSLPRPPFGSVVELVHTRPSVEVALNTSRGRRCVPAVVMAHHGDQALVRTAAQVLWVPRSDVRLDAEETF